MVPCTDDVGTQKLVSKLLALPLLPAIHIPTVFEHLRQAATTGPLSRLFNYVDRQWIQGSFPPEEWSVFMLPIRTNNDVEGWHHRLNTKCRTAHLNMYALVHYLYEEAKLVRVVEALVLDAVATRISSKKYKRHNSNIFGLWHKFQAGELKLDKMLKALAKMKQFVHV